MTTLMPGHAPLKFTPMANLFPMLSEKEIDELGEDIKANGQAETVKLFRGAILDGRNRYMACVKFGLPVRTEVFEGTDRQALAWAVSKNLIRRHLSDDDRLKIGAKLGKLKLGDNQHTREATPIGAPALDFGTPADASVASPAEADGAPLSQSERAEMMQVSHRSLQRADILYEKGTEELQQAFESGKVAVSTAADIAEALPAEEQAKVAQLSEKEILEAAKQIRKKKNAKGRERRLENMRKPDATPLLEGGEKVSVFYVDIPREFTSWSEAGAEKSPENHYRVERLRFLADMREKILARAKPDAVMIMWGWANSLPDQLDLLAEWGFASVRRRDEQGLLMRDAAGEILPPVGEGRYRTHQVWVKRSANGNLHRGTGFWFIDCHELLLIGARGDVPAPLMGTQAMSVLETIIGAHSEKPNELIRDQIDRYFPGVRKLELFGRVPDLAAFKARHPDWEVLGNDVAQDPSQEQAA